MGNLDRYLNWRNKREETFQRGEDSMTRAGIKNEEPSPALPQPKNAVIDGNWLYHEVTFPQTVEAYREIFKTAPIGKWRTDDECWLPAKGYGLLVLPDGTGCISSNSDGMEVDFEWRSVGEFGIECRMAGGEWELVDYDFDSYRDEYDKEFIFLYDTSHNYSFWGIAHHRPLLLSRTITAPGAVADAAHTSGPDEPHGAAPTTAAQE